MSAIGSVSVWLARLSSDEEFALRKLHERYWPGLVALARSQLGPDPANIEEAEDVAQEAFWGFYRSLRAGRTPRLRTRQDFLALLTLIVGRKAGKHLRRECGTAKRGAGWSRRPVILEELARDNQPTPPELALLRDCYEHYLNCLPASLRDYAGLFLAGCTHREIAARLGCVERTSERKIALVREIWRERAFSAERLHASPRAVIRT